MALRARPGIWLRGLLSFRRPLSRLVLAVERCAAGVERVAAAQEEHTEVLRLAYRIARRPGAPVTVEDEVGALQITYSDNAEQALLMDIELQLTAARGVPPSEEEIVAEFDRQKRR